MSDKSLSNIVFCYEGGGGEGGVRGRGAITLMTRTGGGGGATPPPPMISKPLKNIIAYYAKYSMKFKAKKTVPSNKRGSYVGNLQRLPPLPNISLWNNSHR